MGCICQQCGKDYQVDLIIPDDVWEKIKPVNKPKEARLLCGVCIMNKIESFGSYGAVNVDDNAFELPI